ncbi:hypothetical protein BaRGS_00000025 [Batillaria attramentaria]|uniref:Homeobox domain-containing protein n=1 Tax=Batillaria attramentaria TaxID=370345 RepID=A0ABD0M9E1_9CAEN
MGVASQESCPISFEPQQCPFPKLGAITPIAHWTTAPSLSIDSSPFYQYAGSVASRCCLIPAKCVVTRAASQLQYQRLCLMSRWLARDVLFRRQCSRPPVMSSASVTTSPHPPPTAGRSRPPTRRQLFTVEHLARSSVSDTPCLSHSSPTPVDVVSTSPLSSRINTALSICNTSQTELSPSSLNACPTSCSETTSCSTVLTCKVPNTAACESTAEDSAYLSAVHERSALTELDSFKSENDANKKLTENSEEGGAASSKSDSKSLLSKEDTVTASVKEADKKGTAAATTAATHAPSLPSPDKHISSFTDSGQTSFPSFAKPSAVVAAAPKTSRPGTQPSSSTVTMLTPTSLPQLNFSFFSPTLPAGCSPKFAFQSTPLALSPSLGYESGDVSAFQFPSLPLSNLSQSGTSAKLSFLSPSKLLSGVADSTSAYYDASSSKISRSLSASSKEQALQEENCSASKALDSSSSTGHENLIHSASLGAPPSELVPQGVDLLSGETSHPAEAPMRSVDAKVATSTHSPVEASQALGVASAPLALKDGRSSPANSTSTSAGHTLRRDSLRTRRGVASPVISIGRESPIFPPLSPVSKQKDQVQHQARRGTKRRLSPQRTSTPRKADDVPSDSEDESDDSDDDTEDDCGRKRKTRTCFTIAQLTEMEKLFNSNKYLSTNRRLELANRINLHEKQVKTWFQNRRMKEKRQKKAEDEMRNSIPTGGIDLRQLQAYALSGLHPHSAPFGAPLFPGKLDHHDSKASGIGSTLIPSSAAAGVPFGGFGGGGFLPPGHPAGAHPLGFPPGLPPHPATHPFGLPAFPGLPQVPGFDLTSYELGRRHMMAELSSSAQNDAKDLKEAALNKHDSSNLSSGVRSSLDSSSHLAALQSGQHVRVPTSASHSLSRQSAPLVPLPPYPGSTASPFMAPSIPYQGPVQASAGGKLLPAERTFTPVPGGEGSRHHHAEGGTQSGLGLAGLASDTASSALMRPTPLYPAPRW